MIVLINVCYHYVSPNRATERQPAYKPLRQAEVCGGSAVLWRGKILLNVLSDKFLFTEEHITDIIKRTPVSIITVLCDRKYLIISLYFQPQFFFKYSFYLFERFPQLFF